MPVRNTLKSYDAPAYYHVYNRGAGSEPIFHDDEDREKFISLFTRHLDPFDDQRRSDGSRYDQYEIEMIAYCLMGNHFHLLLFQPSDPTAMTKLMRSVATAYTMYFNDKYKRSGHLFQSVFKASMITNDSYLLHITRYIHMNPRSYLRYKWSSLRYYLGEEPPAWLHPGRVNDMTPFRYRAFIESYKSRKVELEMLKDQLADH
jgi:putative transposase